MLEAERRTALLSLVRQIRPDWLEPGARLGTAELRAALRNLDRTDRPVDELAETLSDASARVTLATQPQDLGASDTDALEAIVHTVLRPALLIQDGTFLPPPSEWAQLEQHRTTINAAIASTCRIETTGSSDLDWLGTGFVIAPGLVATNRHVLDLAASRDSGRWEFDPGISLHVDFGEELNGPAPRELPVTGIWGVHSQFDLAILEVPEAASPAPIRPSPQAFADGEDVVVIGYPAFDSRRNDLAVMDQIFRGIYNVKRLLPGKVMGRDLPNWVFRHDASTLGGNSGSPVVSVSTGRLLGIHFRGKYLQWNEAIDFAR